MVVATIFIYFDISKMPPPVTTMGSPAFGKVLGNFFFWRKLDKSSIPFPFYKTLCSKFTTIEEISILNIMSSSNSVVKL